jgi:DNA-binding response OmpR family regulator
MRAKRLLIVEDNPALLRGLKDNFRAEGYQVRTASDGQKGLADMLRDPPDLVLLDLMLPKVSGYEICRAARSRQLSTPILMLTARTDEDDIVRGLELGADDYVTKPFSIRELLARAKVCSHRRLAISAPSAPGASAPAPAPAGYSSGDSRQ